MKLPQVPAPGKHHQAPSVFDYWLPSWCLTGSIYRKLGHSSSSEWCKLQSGHVWVQLVTKTLRAGSKLARNPRVTLSRTIAFDIGTCETLRPSKTSVSRWSFMSFVLAFHPIAPEKQKANMLELGASHRHSCARSSGVPCHTFHLLDNPSIKP